MQVRLPRCGGHVQVRRPRGAGTADSAAVMQAQSKVLE